MANGTQFAKWNMTIVETHGRASLHQSFVPVNTIMSCVSN